MHNVLGPHRVELRELPGLMKSGADILFRQPIGFGACGAAFAGLVYFLALSTDGIDLSKEVLLDYSVRIVWIALVALVVTTVLILAARDDGHEFDGLDFKTGIRTCFVFNLYIYLFALMMAGVAIAFIVAFYGTQLLIFGTPPITAPPPAQISEVPLAADFSSKLVSLLFRTEFSVFGIVLSMKVVYAGVVLRLNVRQAIAKTYEAATKNIPITIFTVIVSIVLVKSHGDAGKLLMQGDLTTRAAMSAVFGFFLVIAIPVFYPVVRKIFGGPAANSRLANDAEMLQVSKPVADGGVS